MSDLAPAPWKLEKCKCGHKRCTSYIVVDKNSHQIGCDGRFDKENAQLIAATPELLEACKEIIECEDLFYAEQNNTQLPEPLEPWADVLQVIFKVANQAIVKAEGRG